MNVRDFINKLKESGLKADKVRALALETYNKNEVDEAIRAAFPDFKEPVEATAAGIAPAVNAETRANEIAEVCTMSGFSARTAEFILSAKTVEQVRSEILAARATEPVQGVARVGEEQAEKTRNALAGAIALRCAVAPKDIEGGEKAAAEITKSGFRGMSLSDMARECLENSGVSTRRMDRLGLVERALSRRSAPGHTTSDFPYILSAAVNKIALKGYENAPSTYQMWTGRGALTDYKSTNLVSVSGLSGFQEIPAGQPAKQMSMSDAKETAQLKDFGGLFILDRQAIINDDLNILTGIGKFLAGGRRKINALCYGQLTTTSLMSDGKALFHSDHKNLGSTAAISDTTITELVKLMRVQKDAKSNPLNISPFAFLTCAAKEGLALKYLATNIPFIADTSAASSTYRGRFQVISDAEIDSQISETAYFLVANPALFDTVTVYFLNGNDQPEIREEESANGDPLGMSWQVVLPVVAKALDYRTMAKNVGA